MKNYIKIVLFGVLLWVIPFAVSVCIYPLKRAGSPLFETIMPLVLTVCVVGFSLLCFGKVREGFLAEGAKLGLIWMAISLALDLPMFLAGPMKMTLGGYLADIGLTYLIFPAVTIGMGLALTQFCRRPAGSGSGDNT